MKLEEWLCHPGSLAHVLFHWFCNMGNLRCHWSWEWPYAKKLLLWHIIMLASSFQASLCVLQMLNGEVGQTMRKWAMLMKVGQCTSVHLICFFLESSCVNFWSPWCLHLTVHILPHCSFPLPHLHMPPHLASTSSQLCMLHHFFPNLSIFLSPHAQPKSSLENSRPIAWCPHFLDLAIGWFHASWKAFCSHHTWTHKNTVLLPPTITCSNPLARRDHFWTLFSSWRCAPNSPNQKAFLHPPTVPVVGSPPFGPFFCVLFVLLITTRRFWAAFVGGHFRFMGCKSRSCSSCCCSIFLTVLRRTRKAIEFCVPPSFMGGLKRRAKNLVVGEGCRPLRTFR